MQISNVTRYFTEPTYASTFKGSRPYLLADWLVSSSDCTADSSLLLIQGSDDLNAYWVQFLGLGFSLATSISSPERHNDRYYLYERYDDTNPFHKKST